MEVDYIIVGLGIAGICLCETLENHKKSFIAIDGGLKGSTANSGGVFNPTVLKRFNAAWNVSNFYPVAISFFPKLEQKLGKRIFHETPILKIFKSIEEQNDWSVASDKRELEQFLSAELVLNGNPNIQASLGFGKVTGTARIDTGMLLSEYREYLKSKQQLIEEEFIYSYLENSRQNVRYNSITARKIIFCEGSSVRNNPFFPKTAIVPNKGEYLVIKAPQLNLSTFLKGPFYIIPQGNSYYKVGATFGRDDVSTTPTTEARAEIVSKLKTMINCPFEIVEQTVGIRPTTKDRKPLLGSFANNIKITFFNGLGTRGFIMAPLLSEIVYDFIENGKPIPLEMDINRIKDGAAT